MNVYDLLLNKCHVHNCNCSLVIIMTNTDFVWLPCNYIMFYT